MISSYLHLIYRFYEHGKEILNISNFRERRLDMGIMGCT